MFRIILGRLKKKSYLQLKTHFSHSLQQLNQVLKRLIDGNYNSNAVELHEKIEGN